MTRIWRDDPLPFRNHEPSSTDAGVPGPTGDRRRQGAGPHWSATVGPRDELQVPGWLSLPRLSQRPRRGRTGVPGPNPLVVLIALWLIGLTLEAILF